MKVRKNISLDADVFDMLVEQAYERHKNVSQYITDYVLTVERQKQSIRISDSKTK